MARRFGRSANDAEPQRPQLRVLRADGRRIDLTSRSAGQQITAARQDWQQRAFDYRDMIPEVRYAVQLLARSVARCRFYVAEARPWPQEPEPLDGGDHKLPPALAQDAIANFDLLPLDTRPDGFLARIVENLELVGEVWVRVDEHDTFHVHSVSEITTTADGKITISTLPGGGASRVLDPDKEVLLRLWRPHPEWSQLADSPMRAALDVAEDTVLAGREQRAAARSRLAANGIMLIPDSLSLPKARDEDDDGDDFSEDTFLADFSEAIVAPILDDGDAQQVVPIVLRGDKEDIAAVQHITLDRADPDKLIERQSTALGRLLKGLDVQPEQVDGVGGMNHWGGWLSEAQQIKHQVTPMAEIVAACLVQAALKPMLESLGRYTPEELDRVTIGVDVSPLTENPNRGQDARDAHERLVISDAKFRAELGYDDEDKPDDDEIIRRLAAKNAFPVGVTAALFGLSQQDVQEAAVIEGTIAEAQNEGQDTGKPALPAGSQRKPAASPGETVPSRPVPAEPSGPPAVTAAAVVDDGWRVDTDFGLALVDIDTRLADRLQVAADDAIARALEKAGARVKGKAQKDRVLAAKLVGVEAHLVPATLGRSQVESFGPIGGFLADEYGRFNGLFRSWLTEAAAKIADLVLDLLGLSPASTRGRLVHRQTVDRLTANTDKAWLRMAETLDEAAARVMFEPDPFNPPPLDEEGLEPVPAGRIVRPREIENVLRVAGGASELPPEPPRGTTAHTSPMRDTTPGPGGFGTGPDVTALLEEHGAVLLGWEWQYRWEIPRGRNFRPWHTRLDKVRFATFTDPKLDTEPETAWIGPYYYPGDHAGCSCRVVPVMAAPELDDDSGGDIVEQRLREARESARARAVSQVAAEDTAAGRVGTSIQMEAEARDRITDRIAELRRRHIDGGNP